MHATTRTILLLAVALTAGCAVQPMTYEESLQTDRATRSDIRDWDEEMRYRVEFQYANTARQKLQMADLDIPPDTNLDFQVPFAIWDYARGDNLSGAIGFADWFNAGLSKNARYGYYFNRGLGYMVNPNTHYVTFDEREGVATAADVHQAWDEAFTLFQSIYDRGRDCHVFGYTEEAQYAKTYPKDVPGENKVVLYLCPHPLDINKQQKVIVTSYANPFEGVRVIAGVFTQCYFDPPKHQKYVDIRACGETLAEQQRVLLTPSRFGWMEMITTPIAETPHLLQVVARRDADITVLPAPETKEDFQEFLKARAYP